MPHDDVMLLQQVHPQSYTDSLNTVLKSTEKVNIKTKKHTVWSIYLLTWKLLHSSMVVKIVVSQQRVMKVFKYTHWSAGLTAV